MIDRAMMTDTEIKECIDTIDFSRMVTADDVFYLVARAIEKHILAQDSQPVSGAMTDERIREIFVANGFKLNGETDGQPDLRPYVYQAAKALLSASEKAAQPVAWMNESGSDIIHAETKQRLIEKAGLGGEFSVAARTAQRYTIPLYPTPAQQIEAPVNVPSKTAAMHSAVRKVLQHHGLTQHGDGVIEADLIYAVLNAAPAPAQTEAQQSEKDVELPAVMLKRATSGMCEVSLEVGGKWVTVIRDNGDIISHIVEPRGIRRAIANEKPKE